MADENSLIQSLTKSIRAKTWQIGIALKSIIHINHNVSFGQSLWHLTQGQKRHSGSINGARGAIRAGGDTHFACR